MAGTCAWCWEQLEKEVLKQRTGCRIREVDNVLDPGSVKFPSALLAVSLLRGLPRLVLGHREGRELAIVQQPSRHPGGADLDILLHEQTPGPCHRGASDWP